MIASAHHLLPALAALAAGLLVIRAGIGKGRRLAPRRAGRRCPSCGTRIGGGVCRRCGDWR